MTPPRRNGSTHRWRQTRARVLREEDICHICGRPVDKTLPRGDPRAPEVDHVTPYAKGGRDYRDNLRLAHSICNREKGDGTGSALVDPTPTSREW